MRPVVRKNSFYSDTTENFISPAQPSGYDILAVRFGAAHNNLDQVYLVHDGKKILMEEDCNDELFDYYITKIQLEDEPLVYHFEVHVGNISLLFDTRGVVKTPDEHFKFKVIPGFKTPEWMEGRRYVSDIYGAFLQWRYFE